MKKIILIVLSVLITQHLFSQTLQWTAVANPDSLQVNAVGFTANDSKIISATNCHPAHIRLWNSNNGSLHWDYEVPTSLMCIMGAGISADSKYLVAVEEMGNILIFDNTTPTPDSINSISMGTTYAFAIDIAPHSHKMVVGASNGKLQCYRLSDGFQLFNVNAHSSWVTAVQYCSDNSKIVSGGNDNKIKIWDSTGLLIHTLNGHTDDITALRFSVSNDTMWSSSLDNTIRMWNVNTGTLIQTVVVSSSDVNAMDYGMSKNILAVSSTDKWVRFFNASSLQLIDSFKQTHDVVSTSLSLSNDGLQLVTGTTNGLVTKYDLSNALGNDEVSEIISKILCYPNPSSGLLKISTSLSLLKYSLMDLAGKTIAQGKVDASKVINIEFAPIGVYYLALYDEKNVIHYNKIQIK
jgi:WD40 repeat protein